MAASNFKPSLTLTLAHEGGYVNHPSDPGGPTNRGITQRVYDAYRQFYHLAPRSVKAITDAEVAEIYGKNYWKLIRGDSLPCGLDYCVFDFAVNSGVSRAVRYLQRSVGVADDGVIGLVTLAAIEACAKADEERLIAQYCANRLAFVRSLSTFATFGKGWTRRIVGSNAGFQDSDSGVIDYAIKMARLDPLFTMPLRIGAKQGEEAGKAIAPLTAETFPTMESVYSAERLKSLAAENDALASRI